MKNLSFKHSESGRTMLEMLGVLGIMGIIMYGAIAGINYGMSTYKINQTYNEIQEAIQGIQDLYSWSRSYDGLNISQVCENDIYTCISNTISNSFGGGISIEPINDNDSFKITYDAVDQASCNRLKEMEWGTIVMDSDNSCTSEPGQAIFCPKLRSDQHTCG